MQDVRAACGPTAVLQTSTSPHTASNWNKMWLDLLGVIEYCNMLRFQIQISRWLTRELSSATRTTLLASVFAEAFGLLFEILITSDTFTNVRTKGTRICGRGAMRVCVWRECGGTAHCCLQPDRNLTALRGKPTSVAPRGLVRRRYYRAVRPLGYKQSQSARGCTSRYWRTKNVVLHRIVALYYGTL